MPSEAKPAPSHQQIALTACAPGAPSPVRAHGGAPPGVTAPSPPRLGPAPLYTLIQGMFLHWRLPEVPCARSTVGAPRMLDERRPHSSPSSQHQLTFHSAGLEPSEAGHPPAYRRQAVRASEGRLQSLGGSPRAAATSGGVPTATLRGREGTPLGRRWCHLASGDKPLGLRNVSVVSGCSRRFRTSRHVGPPCGQTVRREGSR